MGILNEDVFSCKNCGKTVVYEPTHYYEHQFETCHHCGTEHDIVRTIEIKVVKEGE